MTCRGLGYFKQTNKQTTTTTTTTTTEESKLHGSVVKDLRRRGRWFDPRLGQYSFRGLMMVDTTGVIPRSLLFIVSIIVMWESSRRLEMNSLLCGVLVNRTQGKHEQMLWPPRYNLNTVGNGVKHHTNNQTSRERYEEDPV